MSDRQGDLIAAIVRELQVESVGDDGAKARVLAAVHRTKRPSRGRATWRWLSEPRTVRIYPAAVLAAAAAALLAIALWPRVPRPRASSIATTVEHATSSTAPSSAPSFTAAQGAAVRPVQFVLVAPAASRVSLVGDFNGWDAHATPLRATAARGVWTVEIPLTPGRHTYAFVVNGSMWMADPSAPRAPGDDFGTPNSVIVVNGRAT